MRIIGAVLIFFTAAAAGAYFSGVYSSRCRILRCIDRMLGKISAMLRYSAPPVEDILSAVIREDFISELPFIINIREKTQTDTDFRRVWRECLDEWNSLSHIGREEYEILCDLGNDLGASGLESQLENIAAQREHISDIITQAENDRRTKGKLCRSMGVLAGIGAVLVLL